ncbi:hypothetical protein FF011L_35370 [Roseimaritima multifibrata]|uniref:SH3b domain-containing protein n=2 Tax=Roseimaritima multifibrata TaxID=1930274 RepID=A0A517MIN9_9BACT|nr:hypothetical protein FF011L_35370 [Roseimaritima multifibrata]
MSNNMNNFHNPNIVASLPHSSAPDRAKNASPLPLACRGLVAAVVAFAATLGLVDGVFATEEGLVEPYVVFNAQEEAYTRCGPSGEFYRTDPLRLGQELDVYLETKDGWLGVRPPEGSFSWVPASSLDLSVDEKTGVITDRRAVAWIGTHLGRARKYRWQVQLAVGEEVSIIGKTERSSGKGTELWYQIVPPSGEFRWVHRSQIVDTSEQLVEMHRRKADEPTHSLVEVPSQEIADELNEISEEDLVANSKSSKSFSDSSEKSSRRQPKLASIAEVESESPSPSGENSERRSDLDDLSARPVGSGVDASKYADAELTVIDHVSLHDIVDSSSTAQNSSAITRAAPAPPAADMAADDNSWVTGAREQTGQGRSSLASTAPSWNEAGQLKSMTPAGAVTPAAIQHVDHQAALKAEQQARQLAGRVVNSDVTELQLELSRQMAAGASAAAVEPIRRRAITWGELLQNPQSDPVDRERARVLLERVEQYQRIARRRNGEPPVESQTSRLPPSAQGLLPRVGAPQTQTPAATSIAAPILQTVAQVLPGVQSTGQKTVPAAPVGFDREGYLVQVFSARPDAPPYALTDSSGQTLAYVTPQPGVNLKMHLNAKIGLYGKPSYLTGLETPHFIARQAVRISR